MPVFFGTVDALFYNASRDYSCVLQKVVAVSNCSSIFFQSVLHFYYIFLNILLSDRAKRDVTDKVTKKELEAKLAAEGMLALQGLQGARISKKLMLELQERFLI